MGAIRDRMDGDLRLRGLSEVTRVEYMRCARQFVAHYRRSPASLGAEDVRRYLLHLVLELHFSPSNMKIHIAAIKFLYTVTLDRPEVVAKVRFPKVPLKLLDIPSPSEVAAVLSELKSPMYRTLLFCAHGAGLRVSEACKLCVGDIDSKRMVITVRCGKGGRDRYAMLSPVLLDSLRNYYRHVHPPQPYLFQGRMPGKPVPVEGVQTALRMALDPAQRVVHGHPKPGAKSEIAQVFRRFAQAYRDKHPLADRPAWVLRDLEHCHATCHVDCCTPPLPVVRWRPDQFPPCTVPDCRRLIITVRARYAA